MRFYSHFSDVSTQISMTTLPAVSHLEQRYEWVPAIVFKLWPFNSVKCVVLRRIVKRQTMDVKTLMRYLKVLVQWVEEKIQTNLPDRFRLVFDGWRKNCFHFVSFLALYSSAYGSEQVLFLFRMFPFCLDKSLFRRREFMFPRIRVTLKITLSSLWKHSNVVCMPVDSTNLNPALANIWGVRFIGRASYRFNLKVQAFLNQHETRLPSNQELMLHLRALKSRAKLAKWSGICPVIRCRRGGVDILRCCQNIWNCTTAQVRLTLISSMFFWLQLMPKLCHFCQY